MTERYDTRLWGGFVVYMRYAQLDQELFEGEYDEDVEIWDCGDAEETLRAMGYPDAVAHEIAWESEGDWPGDMEERVHDYVIERGEWL